VVGVSDYQANGSPLRRLLEDTAAAEGLSMKDLTVLAPQNDPFRVDTPAGHRDGAWLAATARELGLGDRRIHLRGLHYMVLGRPKPDGTAYANSEADWLWLSGQAGKAARWLGYLPFDQVVDQRNSAPIVRPFRRSEPRPYLTVDVDIDVPPVEDLMPSVGVADFNGVQPFKLVLFGEKSSLAEVLEPIASEHKADLYLPTGEISDTLLHQMAKVGAEDGRSMAVLCFSDADPAGWQMPVSISRKLQAFRALYFADLRFQVYRAALTPTQAGEYGLPSTPLKDTEKRGDAWRAAMGTEQTEIDALASLRPDLLREIARAALAPFFDYTLDGRVEEAWEEWNEEAARIATEQLGAHQLGRLQRQATEKLATIRAEVDALKAAMRFDTSDLRLPEAVVPEAELNGHQPALPLADSAWSFAEQCRRLLDSKGYRQQGGGA
jgi:hypothetical protein